MERVKRALKWVKGVLEHAGFSYQLSGGLAAHAYGAKRPIADIDIEVHDDAIHQLAPLLKDFTIEGPRRYKDESFDVLLLTLEYKGQKIDISGIDSERVHDLRTNAWVETRADLSKAVRRHVLGVTVPVIPEEKLEEYKKHTLRKVDRQDLKDVEAQRI
jgi:hypothetical protein